MVVIKATNIKQRGRGLMISLYLIQSVPVCFGLNLNIYFTFGFDVRMSKVAVKIEKRLNKLNNKRKISKHALNKKRQLAADNTNSRKPSGGKGKFSSNMKSGKRRK